jgi:hypothetical protein
VDVQLNVALSDDGEHGGGRLVAIYDGAVRTIERCEGAATLHPSSLMHAVTRMTDGTRQCEAASSPAPAASPYLHAILAFTRRRSLIEALNRRRADGP